MLTTASLLLCLLSGDQLVRVEGTRFMIGDQPLHFVGANAHIMHGADARAAAESTLSTIARDGLRVVRVWAFGEGRSDASDSHKRERLFRAGPQGWRSEAMVHLDRVVAHASRLGLRLIVTLANNWPDYGGIPMYLRWIGHDDWNAYGYGDRFFVDPRARETYAAHVRRIVQRYRDEPAIMAWELVNEPRGTEEGRPHRLEFFREMTQLVRSIDPNHLIATGFASYGRGGERDEWVELCKLPEVDWCDHHLYVDGKDRLQTRADVERFIDDRVWFAHHVVGKPLVFGEFGFRRSGRAKWFATVLRRLREHGAAGSLVWIYQPDLGWERPYGIYFERKESRTVRHLLRRESKLAAAIGGPSRAPPKGSVWPLSETKAGRRRPHVARDGAVRIPPDQFAAGRWEEMGVWAGGILVHAWGAGVGYYDYRFSGVNGSVRIRARLSSEYPGRVSPPHGTSRVRVLVDGQEVAQLLAPPDDGMGDWFELEAELEQRKVHTLRFEVPKGDGAHGIALYGREAADNRVPVGEVGTISVTRLVEP